MMFVDRLLNLELQCSGKQVVVCVCFFFVNLQGHCHCLSGADVGDAAVMFLLL